jgi:two-component system LytT family response regulator
MIKAIIVDDEPNCCKTLSLLLSRYCPEVEVTGTYHNGVAALQAIEASTPDLVFLDVEMPRMNGFEMLEQLPSINFHLIFTTSYDQYALKAFRFSAVDYLLKPVDREELQKAVQKVLRQSEKLVAEQIQILLQKANHPAGANNKIALPTMEGLQMIPIDTILFCESDDNYTKIVLKNTKKIVVSRTLKEIEEMLEEHSFVRVHRSYLVNINEIEKYIKGEGGYLVMSDGTNIDVSRSKKDILLKRLLPYKE